MTPAQRAELQRLAEQIRIGREPGYAYSRNEAADLILSLLSDAAESGFYKAGMGFWKGEAETQESRYEGLVEAARRLIAVVPHGAGYGEALDALDALTPQPQGTEQ